MAKLVGSLLPPAHFAEAYHQSLGFKYGDSHPIAVLLLFAVSLPNKLFMKVLYADEKKRDVDLSFQETLLEMRTILGEGRFKQIPQLTSSRPLDIHHKFDLVPDDFNGTRRAVLIGINYVGQQGA